MRRSFGWVKIHFFLGCVLCLILPAVAVSQESSDEKKGVQDPNHQNSSSRASILYRDYRYDFRGCSVLIPDGWREGKGAGNAFASFYDSKGPARDTVRIDLFVLQGIKDLKTAARSLQRGYQGKGLNYREKAFEKTEINGRTGLVYGGRYTSRGIRMEQRDVVILEGNVLYLVSGKGRKEKFRQRREEIEFALDSLQVFNPPGVDEDTQKAFEAAFDRGESFVRKKEYKKAIQQFRAAARIYPYVSRVHARLFDLYRQEMRWEHAIREMKVRIDQVRAGALQYNELGEVCYRAGRLEEAIEQFEKAISLNGKYVEALENLAIVHRANGDTDRALSIARKITKLRPESPKGFFMLGIYYTDLRKYSLAEKNLEKVRKLDPDHKQAKRALKRVQVLKKEK